MPFFHKIFSECYPLRYLVASAGAGSNASSTMNGIEPEGGFGPQSFVDLYFKGHTGFFGPGLSGWPDSNYHPGALLTSVSSQPRHDF